MNVQLSFNPSIEEYGKGLQDKAGLLERVLADKVNSLSYRMLQFIQGELSGEVLQQRTGVLIRSVEVQAADWVGSLLSSTVGIDDGAPSFKYGIVHELGGLGYYDIFPKEALALAFEGGVSEIEGPARGGTLTAIVKHVHHPPAQKRSFIAPAIDAFESIFYAELDAALTEVLNG